MLFYWDFSLFLAFLYFFDEKLDRQEIEQAGGMKKDDKKYVRK